MVISVYDPPAPLHGVYWKTYQILALPFFVTAKTFAETFPLPFFFLRK